jgi:hypothetical protein
MGGLLFQANSSLPFGIWAVIVGSLFAAWLFINSREPVQSPGLVRPA